MIELIISIGIVCFLLLYFSFNLEKKHFLLKLIITFVVFFMVLLIPKININYENCTNEITNQTISGNITTYEYKLICKEQTSQTGLSFYKNYLTYIVIFIIYIFVYFVYEVLNFFNKTATIKNKIQNFKNNNRK